MSSTETAPMTLIYNVTNTTLPTSTEPYTESPKTQQNNFWIGLGLAVGSSFFIGTSFIFQKLGLKNVAKKEGGVRAADGGHMYLCQWKWWIGMLLMAMGEGCNFLAFTFAPATLITPLGALSVVFSAVLASYFLKEGLNLLGKLGCILCVLGSTIIVIHSPRYAEVQNMHDLLMKIKEPGILTLVGVFIAAAAVTIIFIAPKYGNSNVAVYIFICSTLGALTVMGVKGVGVALKETFAGRNEFTNWLTYVMIGVAAVDIVFQINFLNKALDTFNTAVVTPTYYVMFTSCVALMSLVLYREFSQLRVEDIIGMVVGFFVIVCGIFMLNVFKEMNITYKNLPSSKKKQVEMDILDGVRMPLVVRDSSFMLNCHENESEDDSEPYADDTPLPLPSPHFSELDRGYINPTFVESRVDIHSDLVKNAVHRNGHVKHLSDVSRASKHSDKEVTHF